MGVPAVPGKKEDTVVSQVGVVFDIKRFAIHDGPGIRTTAFMKGCPLSCWWCHNPESQAVEPELSLRTGRCIKCGACLSVCPHDAILRDNDAIITERERCELCGTCARVCNAEAREMIGSEMTVEQLVAEVERDIAFYDESGGGVTFSGGEPLVQRDFLLASLRVCKEKGIHTAVDTCGFADWEAFDSIRKYVDLFLYDLRLMDDEKHKEFTGVSNESILRNLTLLSRGKHSIALRVPIVPGINDDDRNLQEMGAFAAELPNLSEVNVLLYHRMGVEKYDRLGRKYGLRETEPPAEERMAEIKRILRSFGLRVRTGGVVDGDE